METPVLLIAFNRPDVTRAVFNTIRDAQPEYLYFAADGPRSDRPDDSKKCIETRSVINEIDWPCSVKTLFRDHNLGCRSAVSSAISWFFEHVEEGIILEDDCLPHPDFFPFCEKMLALYRNDVKVMHVTGGNFQMGKKIGDTSYYFSRIAHVWGWASWRRAWKVYDVNMIDFEAFSKSKDRSDFFFNRFSERYWMKLFNHVYFSHQNTWDYQWNYAIMKNRGYCIIPNVNLISNIGFGSDATHTTENTGGIFLLPVSPIFPLVFNSEIIINEDADLRTITKIFPIPTIRKRIINKVKKVLARITLNKGG